MILAITGTPGTGKTSVAAELAKITGWQAISLNELAELKGLYSGYDAKRRCKVVDIAGIKSEILRMVKTGKNLIIESHYVQDIDSDLVIVLRANPDEIRLRGREKGWHKGKIEENVQAEIMEECKTDAISQGRKTRELDTTGKSPETAAVEIAKIIQRHGMFVNNDLKIQTDMKAELRKPYGKLFTGIEPATDYVKGGEIISVGDFVTYSLYKSAIMPRIFVIDGLVRRKPFEKRIPLDYDTITAKNSAGYLSRGLWTAVQHALDANKKVKIIVEGEEDMAVLPFLLLARLGIYVVYGMFDRGVCVIKIDEKSKKMARDLLRRLAAASSFKQLHTLAKK